jgi:hypothetical protein
VGLAFTNPPKIDGVGIVVYKSIDGGVTWSDPSLIHESKSDDKQWAAADNDKNSPYRGRVYAVWMDGTSTTRFARTLTHGQTTAGIPGWMGTAKLNSDGTVTYEKAGSVLPAVLNYPEINVAADKKGTIYVVGLASKATPGLASIQMVVSTDGGDSFHSKEPPAKDIHLLASCLDTIHDWPVFSGGSFRVLTLPTACTGPEGVVMVAWADCREGVSRIYYARSNDGGDSWVTGPTGQPLLTSELPSNQQHFHPQIVMRPNGAVGCAFYEFGPKPTDYLIDVIMAPSSDGKTFSRYTVTDQPWDPAINAPWAHYSDPPYIDSSLTFIGEYFGLDASDQGFYPLWTDTRTGIQELWVNVPSPVVVAGPPKDMAKPPAHLEKALQSWLAYVVGLIDDSGGWIIPMPGKPKPSPPPPFDLTNDILLGLANYRIATLVTSKDGIGLQKAALNMLARLVRQQLQRLEDNV